jgi:hypothetical protein
MFATQNNDLKTFIILKIYLYKKKRRLFVEFVGFELNFIEYFNDWQLFILHVKVV